MREIENYNYNDLGLQVGRGEAVVRGVYKDVGSLINNLIISILIIS